MTEEITFSFGENWLNFIDKLDHQKYEEACQSLTSLLHTQEIAGKTFLDIGCGSGLFSAAAMAAGAKTVHSVDVDPKSAEASRVLHTKMGATSEWTIEQGSILDFQFLQTLPRSDIVYSWGVLHHTGEMWQAIKNAMTLVNPKGLFVIAIYNKHWTSQPWLLFKRLYNRSTPFIKTILVWLTVIPRVLVRVLKGKHPLQDRRGMSIYYDAIDWAGGLPYEYASFDEIVQFCQASGFTLEHSTQTPSTGCNEFVFRKS